MNILLACDHDTFNDAIAQFVINYPWPKKSVFQIVNVVPGIYDYAYAAAVPELMLDLKDDAINAAATRVRDMALKLRDHFHTNNIKESILEGNPAETILDTAENWPADLIVMGSHGRTGLNKLFMGSVSSAVLEHAHCSVVIVKEQSKESNTKSDDLKVEAKA